MIKTIVQEITLTRENIQQVLDHCIDLILSRNKRYGGSLDIMLNSSIVDLVLMKLLRTRALSPLDEKYVDEIQDSINYLLFLLMRKVKPNESVHNTSN